MFPGARAALRHGRAARLLLACAWLLSGAAVASDAVVGTLRIRDPHAPPTVPGARSGAVYLQIENTGTTPDVLRAASSPLAGAVDVHEMRMENGIMRMRALPSLAIPAGRSVALGPGAYHLMLTDLKAPLEAGTTLALTLEFERAGPLELAVPVRRQGGNAATPGTAPAGSGSPVR